MNTCGGKLIVVVQGALGADFDDEGIRARAASLLTDRVIDFWRHSRAKTGQSLDILIGLSGAPPTYRGRTMGAGALASLRVPDALAAKVAASEYRDRARLLSAHASETTLWKQPGEF